MRRLIFVLLSGMVACSVFSQTPLQKTWSNWAGAPYGIAFRNGLPQDFYIISPPGGLDLPWASFYTYNGGLGVAYSDSLSGNVKFVAMPTTVYNRNYDTVTNGYGLISCGAYGKDAVLVIPFPNKENKFYIVHQFPGSSLEPLPGLQTRCSVYAYATGMP